jgi:integrase
MARSNSTKPPSYRLHRASGQAVCTIARKDNYLGKHGSPESRLRYERLISRWMQGGTTPNVEPDADPGTVTIAELGAMYLKWAKGHYRKGGKETSEATNVKRAIRCLRECYAALPTREFSPMKLKVCRDKLVTDGLARSNVNRYVAIITRLIGYGVENELVSGEVWHSLHAVKPLQRGRSEARETDPVLPVTDEQIDATLPYLLEPYRTIVKAQLLLACRPGELVSLTPADIDRSRPIWVYTPRSHKGQHHDKTRLIPIGPKARLLIQPFLPEFPAQLVFRTARGGPITAENYAQTIARACQKAGVAHWSPNMLRHAAATKIREHAGLDAAQVILGHSSVSTTQIYAEKNLAAALKIAAEVG